MEPHLNASAGKRDIPADENAFVVILVLFVHLLHILTGRQGLFDFFLFFWYVAYS